ncbi:NTP transferase domain-containing protein [Patescibacteria group bacterium]|nr:NTP transferase domain-containing protein [Patescibacteria group bacterium]
MKIVILAGGGGSRLWPLSREKQPKQFSRIIGERTMFEQTVDRFLRDFSVNDIYVSLNKDLLATARALAPEIPENNFIIEPEKRDTAPAMGFAAAYLFNSFPDEPIAYIPSDHFIAEKEKFLKIINLADKMIRQTGKMVDIAIWPTFASTVLGYTRIGKKLETVDSIAIYEFLGHTEKPDFETAKAYLENGNYLWHASYYMWTPRKILQAFRQYSPAHYELLNKISGALANGSAETVEKAFSQMEKISFDYAITEKIDPKEVLIVRGDFGWSDLGAFDVLYDAQKARTDNSGNLIFADWAGEDTSGCIIYGKKNKIVATLGIDDLVIVDSDDALLICPKTKAQEIKKLLEKMKTDNKHDYL